MRVALIGSVSSSWHTLHALIGGEVAITCVLGLDESHAGRVSDYRSLRKLATEAGLPYRSFDKVVEPGVRAFLEAHPPDLLFVVGLSQLVPEEMFSLAPGGVIGFHPTPLPQGRGRAPVAWTILLEQPAAANLFFLTAGADEGDIIEQRPVDVRPDDYARQLIDRTNTVLEQMVIDLAPAIRSGTLPRQPQDHRAATWYGRRRPSDGLIDWAAPVQDVYRLIRACSHPYPGAFTYYEDERVVVWRAKPHGRADHFGTLGQVLRVDGEAGLLVQAGDGLLWLTDMTDGDGAPLSPERFRVGMRLGVDLVERVAALEGRVRALERRAGSGGSGEGVEA